MKEYYFEKSHSVIFINLCPSSLTQCCIFTLMLLQSSFSLLVCVLCKGATAGTCHRDGCAVSSLLLPNDGLLHLSSFCSPLSSSLLCPHCRFFFLFFFSPPGLSTHLLSSLLVSHLFLNLLSTVSLSTPPPPPSLSSFSSRCSSPVWFIWGSHETLIACKSKRCRCD